MQLLKVHYDKTELYAVLGDMCCQTCTGREGLVGQYTIGTVAIDISEAEPGRRSCKVLVGSNCCSGRNKLIEA